MFWKRAKQDKEPDPWLELEAGLAQNEKLLADMKEQADLGVTKLDVVDTICWAVLDVVPEVRQHPKVTELFERLEKWESLKESGDNKSS